MTLSDREAEASRAASASTSVPAGSPVGLAAIASPDTAAQLPAPVARPLHGVGGSIRQKLRAPVRLRPMTIADLLDGGFAVLRARPRLIAICALIVAVPTQILGAWLQRGSLDAISFSGIWSDPSLAENDTGSAFDVTPVLIQSFGVSLLTVPVMVILASRLGGVDQADSKVLGAMLRKSPLVIAAWLVVHAAEAVGLLAVFVGAFYIMGALLVTIPALAAENIGPIAAVRRSWRLTATRRWPMVGIGLLSALVIDTLSGILGLVPSAIATELGSETGWLVLAAGNTAIGLLTMPLTAAVACVAYLDLRVRTEGLDLEMDALSAFGEER